MNAFDRLEFIADINYSANATAQLPTNGGMIPNDRYMVGLILSFEGRYVPHATLGPSAILADELPALINRITVRGNHRPRNAQETFFDLRGPEVYQLGKIQNGLAPLRTPAALDKTGSATNDFKLIYPVIFTPMGVGISQRAQYLLDAPNYDSLTLNVQFADEKNIGSGQTGAGALTAYGSASGVPKVRVSGIFAQDGARKFSGFVPARVFRTFVEYQGAELTTNSTNGARLFNPPKGYGIRSLLLKTGVKATTVTAGNDAYATLSDSILANIKLNLGLNRAIRFFPGFFTMAAEVAMAYGVQPSTGYGLIDFCKTGALDLALNTAPFLGGASGDTDFYISADTTATSNQAALLVTEELRYRAGQVRQVKR